MLPTPATFTWLAAAVNQCKRPCSPQDRTLSLERRSRPELARCTTTWVGASTRVRMKRIPAKKLKK